MVHLDTAIKPHRMGQRAGRTQPKSRSALLQRILYGGSSLTFCPLTYSREREQMGGFFQSPSLDNVIVFKYPNFDAETADPRASRSGFGTSRVAQTHPIETGIFVPYDTAMPGNGGLGIYLRQREFMTLLSTHLGIDLESERPAVLRDKSVLEIIDEVPSLDPFLMKSAFEGAGIEVNEAYLQINRDEERAIRSIIETKVMPIALRAAQGGDSKAMNPRRIIEAIWNPRAPEATLFIAAFGISPHQAPDIFSGLKGISFYQYQYYASQERVQGLYAWLASSEAEPSDRRQNMAYMPNFDMFKDQIMRGIADTMAQTVQVFQNFDDCIKEFANKSNPLPLRAFLLGATDNYWLLGFWTSSLSHVCAIWEEYEERATMNRLDLESFTEMFSTMRTALSSRSGEFQAKAAAI